MSCVKKTGSVTIRADEPDPNNEDGITPLMTTEMCHVLNEGTQFLSGTAEVLAHNGETATVFQYAFLATDFVALWEIPTVPDSVKGCRLRWRSQDKKMTRYFRVIQVEPCGFPVVHVDLRLERELATATELKARQDEIVAELNQLTRPSFSESVPLIPENFQFDQARRDAKRNLLRRELGDIAAMLAQITPSDSSQQSG